MSTDPHAQFDHTVLDMIERSPTGAVPVTPAYQDALTRLKATHQIYAHADHKGGYVTVRSLTAAPSFLANNFAEFIAGGIDADGLETNASIYTRYMESLSIDLQARSEALRVMVIGKPSQHRAKHGTVIHDPLHTLFLVPGAGPHPGLPGNYLHGAIFHVGADDATGAWVVHVHDADDGSAVYSSPNLPTVLAKMQEVIESVPFHLSELDALGLEMK